ncbi:MAG: hypothetical protein NT013_02530 [Planctomycetia bacterium]|nr:hypothetical protein [Planctomycetia bacterium]
MVGHRHEMDSIGDSYESFAESVLSRIAALTRIGVKTDFGTDMYCQPRIKSGDRMEAITELCLLQVKGGTPRLEYGGVDASGKWKDHEFEWLKNLWAPLFLATVDAKYEKVDVFSLWPIWWVLWQCGTPFKIVCTWRDDVESPYEFAQPTKETVLAGPMHGDGQKWIVDLGAPILRLTHQSLNTEEFRNRAIEVLRYWIQVDRITVARFHARVPLIDANYRWLTNQIPNSRQELLAMDARPGMNIEWLAKALVPSLLGLGTHLQHQGNRDAFRLVPILEWVESNAFGNLFTPKLLENLSRAQREDVSPATYI